MTSSSHAHSWLFAWSPAAFMTILERAQHIVSQIPIGRTPGFLSRATRWKVINAQYAAQEGEYLFIHSASLTKTALKSSSVHPKLMYQFCSSITSPPLMGITRSTLPQNNVNLPLPFFGSNYPIVLLNNIY